MSRLVLHSLEADPIHRVRTLNARRGGGTESVFVPVLRGVVGGLPKSLDGLILTSDLQGRVADETGVLQLSGVAVAMALSELEGEIPPLARCGAILAGDLFSVPDATKRGGFGDVGPVWRAFQQRCAWVAGVAGNHDDVSSLPSGVHLLDSETVVLDGLRLGGVGLICGEPSKPGRRADADQLAAIELVMEQSADLLVLHEGPRGNEDQRGNELIPPAPFVVCGHVHWDEPVHRHSGGVVINVDGRVVVLMRDSIAD